MEGKNLSSHIKKLTHEKVKVILWITMGSWYYQWRQDESLRRKDYYSKEKKKSSSLGFLKIRWVATRSSDFLNYKNTEKEHGIPVLVVAWKTDGSDQKLHEVSLKKHFGS